MATTGRLNAASKRWRTLINSPTWLRDATTVTSPWRLGFWFLILNTLIIVSLIFTYAKVTTDLSRYRYDLAVVAEMGLGRLFSGTIFLALTFFLTIFVPLRVAGVFLGPRVGRYFDQIVLSGITPWRFLIGKVIGQQAFFATAIAVSLPYFILCLSFGAVSFWEVILCATMLFVYIHVLVVVYLAISTLLSEIVALPLVIGVFFAAAIFGLEHLSPNPIGGMTPVSTILGMFYEDTYTRQTYTFRGGFGSLGLTSSNVLLYSILSACTLGLGSLAVALGPINALANGLNTFGAVVFPGDKKRSSWLKRRFGLRRQAELSFLYENNSTAWRACDFRRRWSLRELTFGLLIASALIWTYWLFPPFGSGFYALLMFLCICAIFLNIRLFADPWMAERLYAKRFEAGTLNAMHFLGNSVMIWLGFGWLPAFLGLDVTPQDAYRGSAQLEIQDKNLICVTQFVLMGTAFYAIVRWFIVRRLSGETSAFLALFVMIVLAFVPFWVGLFGNLITPLDSPDHELWMMMGFPLMLIESIESVRWLGYRALSWSASFYTVITLLFAMLAWKRRQQLPRRRL